MGVSYIGFSHLISFYIRKLHFRDRRTTNESCKRTNHYSKFYYYCPVSWSYSVDVAVIQDSFTSGVEWEHSNPFFPLAPNHKHKTRLYIGIAGRSTFWGLLIGGDIMLLYWYIHQFFNGCLSFPKSFQKEIYQKYVILKYD